MIDELFVYGTLHPDHAPDEIADVVRKFVPLGDGRIYGERLNLGEYPGVIVDGAEKQTIPGTVFRISGGTKALQRLDRYEEFFPKNPQKSLFIRRKVDVEFEDGSHRPCWVYLYNRSAESAA